MATNDIKIYNTTGLTATITLSSLASLTTGNARQGNTIDFTATRSELWLAKLQVAFAAAPTAGGTVDLYMAWSSSSATLVNTNFPGGCTGVDAAYTGPDGAPAAGSKQLDFIGSLVACATGSTIKQIQQIGVLTAKAQYGVPVLLNNTTQLLSTTAADQVLEFIPIIPQIQAAV